ncbi:MAG: fimbrillin family protein [Bacteroides sp.]|nr:fimbrillin family protein [Bacteroides sp.]
MKKKQFFMTALAAIALASCSNDEVVTLKQGDSIGFRTSMNRTTSRAAETTIGNLGTFYATAIGNSAAYFSDLAVTYTNKSWVPAGTYYWPDYDLAFYAYAPKTSATGDDYTLTPSIGANEQTIAYKPATTASAQKDLVVAYNTVAAPGANEVDGRNSVSLNFKHALSQIEVQATNASSTYQVDVIGVKVANVAESGTFTYDSEVTTASHRFEQGVWTGLGSATTYTVAKTDAQEVITLGSTAESIMFTTTDVNNNWMLIPQSTNQWVKDTQTTGSYIAVLCRISRIVSASSTEQIYPDSRVDADLVTTVNGVEYAYSAVPVSISWLPGYKYTYTLNFFADGGGAGVIDPDDDDNGGDAIIGGGTISYTVTVDEEWIPASGSADME